MLYLVLGDNHTRRGEHIASITPSEGEVFIFDETQGSLADLEQFLYPSLFMASAPIVHLKYMLDTDVLTGVLLQKLLASPTVFIFEEIEIPSPIVTSFKKAGAIVHTQEKIKSIKKESDIFVVTAALTAPDKKRRWMAYREALMHHPVEAIIGILYWKVRDMVSKMPKEKEKHLAVYKALLEAHARAWESGVPLELVIEKVILTQ
jgi:hypothetical protein